MEAEEACEVEDAVADLAGADESSGVDLDLEGEAGAASLKRGLRAVQAHCKHAPMGPGVYRMLGEDGAVLYVGKAKSLRKRVASYTRPPGHTNRIARMIALTCSMVFVSTRTEVEALLLEANLIKQLKPRFNVLLRDDKSFPYILLTKDERGAQLTKHRGARSRKGDYFGPFASVWAVNRTLNALQRAFLLRSCENSFYDNRTRPCLLFQIKRCSGPCTGEVSGDNYAELTREARDFLTGKSRAVREQLAGEMNAAAEKLEFERAARLRDRISALAAIQGQQGVNPRGVAEADVFAVHEEAGQFCVEAVFYRAYQNWGNRAYFPRADRTLPPARCWAHSSPSSTPSGRPRNSSWSRTRSRKPTGSRRRSGGAAGPQGRNRGAAARRKMRDGGRRPQQRPRGLGAPPRRQRQPDEAAGSARRGLRHGQAAAPRRGL